MPGAEVIGERENYAKARKYSRDTWGKASDYGALAIEQFHGKL